MAMKNSYLAIIILALALSAAYAAISYEAPDPLKHDTGRWAVIEDVNGDMMAVETTSDGVWSDLSRMNQDGTQLWVGGVVESYGSSWGFRFRPDTVLVAEVTAEGLQATIAFISSDIGYWQGLGYAYISARVIAVNS